MMDLQTFLFWTVALLTGLCAIAVVVTQNIVRSAAYLLFTLAGTAAIFFLIGTDFVAATQLIIYVGGILVLVVFGVMLTAQGPFITMKTGAAEWAIAAVVGVLLFIVLASSIAFTHWNGLSDSRSMNDAANSSYSARLGEAFLGLRGAASSREHLTGLGIAQEKAPLRTAMGYLLPFEIVSVHLLVVLIAAAYLARAKRRRGAVT